MKACIIERNGETALVGCVKEVDAPEYSRLRKEAEKAIQALLGDIGVLKDSVVSLKGEIERLKGEIAYLKGEDSNGLE